MSKVSTLIYLHTFDRELPPWCIYPWQEVFNSVYVFMTDRCPPHCIYPWQKCPMSPAQCIYPWQRSVYLFTTVQLAVTVFCPIYPWQCCPPWFIHMRQRCFHLSVFTPAEVSEVSTSMYISTRSREMPIVVYLLATERCPLHCNYLWQRPQYILSMTKRYLNQL